MILVTGATGTIGGTVLRLLAARGAPARAMTRDPGRAAVPAGVEVAGADFADAASLARALAGVDTVFLATAPGPGVAAHDTALLTAVRSAGVGRVVKLSAIGTGDAAAPRLGGWHRPGEAALRDSGLAWTLLRPSAFASNALAWVPAVRAGGPVPNPTGTGAQGVVDPEDVAAVAVEALTSAGHDGATYTLTGPALLTVADQVRILGAALGRELGTVDVSLDEARRQMVAAGLDADVADAAVAGVEYIRAGGNAVLTGDVERVTGRAPRGFADWATAHRAVYDL